MKNMEIEFGGDTSCAKNCRTTCKVYMYNRDKQVPQKYLIRNTISLVLKSNNQRNDLTYLLPWFEMNSIQSTYCLEFSKLPTVMTGVKALIKLGVSFLVNISIIQNTSLVALNHVYQNTHTTTLAPSQLEIELLLPWQIKLHFNLIVYRVQI